VTVSASFPALGTTAVVAVTHPDALPDARAALERELAEVDRTCSRFRDNSELSRANASAGSEVRVGPLLLEALRIALRAARVTDGLVDPTVGRTLRLAGYDRTFRLVAARRGDGFETRFERVPGWTCVGLDEERSLLRVPADVELDLGATAKALAADRGAAAAHEVVGCGVLVGLGGDISIAGAPPGDGWPVRLADDHGVALDAPGPTVALFAGGLASSGTTVRRWRSVDAELHHIIDPRTGRPAVTPWRTVSVAAASCVDANTAGTAAVVLGHDAPSWLAERGLPARLVRQDGVAVCVGGWPEDSVTTLPPRRGARGNRGAPLAPEAA
jgi:FAD:protein FMN transferase